MMMSWAFPVDWLHQALDAAAPGSAVLMLDASFGPRPLPCAGDDPHLIEDTLFRDRRDYQRVAGVDLPRADNVELSATTSLEPRLCDRFDQVLDGIERPLFTKYLIRGVVERKADLPPFGDDDGLIELGELTDYLDDNLKRAARFQWGRLQNVRAVGPRGRVLASVAPRKLSPLNAEVVKRRNRPEEPSDEEKEEGEEDREARATKRDVGNEREEVKILPDDQTQDCSESNRSGLCAEDLTAGTENVLNPPNAAPPGRASVVAVASPENEQREDMPPARERTAACRWVAGKIAPYASVLVQRISGDTGPSCAWAADRSEVKLGPIAQIFTPIAWRLGRSTAQDAMLCLLDCDHSTTPIERDPSDRAGAAPEPAVAATEPRREPVDPRTLSAFNRQICDQLEKPVPPYIGIPRWMPGTLIISEALRLGQGCPPPPPEPALPVPLAIALEAPIEIEAPAPSPDRRPAVIATEDRLARRPPYAVGIDMPPMEREKSPMEGDELPIGGGVSPPETGVDIETADSTPFPEDDIEAELASPFEAPFAPSVSKVRWLQSALTVDNRNPGPIDGVIGKQTEDAVQSWRRDNGRTDRTGELTEIEFQEIIRAFGERFDQIEDRVRAF